MQILNHAAVQRVAEGGCIVLVEWAAGRAVADGEGISLSVEGSHHVVITAARHAGNGIIGRSDVCTQFDGLTCEAVPGIVVLQEVAEHVPTKGRVYGVGVFAFVTEVVSVETRGGRYEDVGGGHRECPRARAAYG